jgi:hypothetical protein
MIAKHLFGVDMQEIIRFLLDERGDEIFEKAAVIAIVTIAILALAALASAAAGALNQGIGWFQ